MRFGSTDTPVVNHGRTSELSDIDLTQSRPVFNNFAEESEPRSGLINLDSRPYRPWYQRGLILGLIAFSFFATVAFVIYFQSDPGYQTVFDDSEVGLATTTTIPEPLSPVAQRASTLPSVEAATTTTSTTVAPETPATVAVIPQTITPVIEPTTTVELESTVTSEPQVASSETTEVTLAETTSSLLTSSSSIATPVPVSLSVIDTTVGLGGEAVSGVAATGTSDSLRFRIRILGCEPGQIANVWIFGGDLVFTQIAEEDCSRTVIANVDGLSAATEYGIRIRTGSTWVYRASLTTPAE